LQESVDVAPIRHARRCLFEQRPGIILTAIKPQDDALEEEQYGVVGMCGAGGGELLQVQG
jgi:hypothetical protein